MSPDLQSNLWSLLMALPALVIGLTVHEFAHAWAAMRLGDDLAQREGRLTLDPLAHLDLFGTIFMLVAWMTGYGVGWAKPVPVHVERLRKPRRDSMLVALAGPVSNLLQVPIWVALLSLFNFCAMRYGWMQSPGELFMDGAAQSPAAIIGQILLSGIVVNIGMAAFNMIPIPPLDGHWVLASLGPDFIGEFFNVIRPFGFLLVIVLFQIPTSQNSVLGSLLDPVYDTTYQFIFALLSWTS